MLILHVRVLNTCVQLVPMRKGDIFLCSIKRQIIWKEFDLLELKPVITTEGNKKRFMLVHSPLITLIIK